MNPEPFDMLNDDEIAAYLTSRGWHVNIIPDPNNTHTRFLMWSPWKETK